MLFNTVDFALFLPIVFLLYWFVFAQKLQWQNLLLVAASYFFYGWWDWRFLSLIFFSSIVDYTIGLQLGKSESKRGRRALLVTSILVNLGFLGFFKYYNFFLENFVEAFEFFGHSLNVRFLHVILPVGISFYTFQTLSYTIDVYRKKLEPTKDPVAFFAFVSFFPQLVAGPIERASNLLPQFFKKRQFDYELASNGMRQILWGLFKKMVIADNCAEYVNMAYANPDAQSGSTLLLGAIFFSFQIYGDFSGYSDIAIGTSRLFGFDLKKNFAFPYFSRDIGEFWRRWHISLTTWFRDYLYIPLGGSRGGTFATLRNVMIIFLVSGFWHGSKWTFILWGALNALYFVPLLLLNRNRKNLDNVAEGKTFVGVMDGFKILFTFGLAVMAWVLFRAESVAHAMLIYDGIISPTLLSVPEGIPIFTVGLVGIFVFIEWLGRESEFAIEHFFVKKHIAVRWSFYLFVAFMISIFSAKEQIFIYFQF